MPGGRGLSRLSHAVHIPLIELIDDSPDQDPVRGVCLRDPLRSESIGSGLFDAVEILLQDLAEAKRPAARKRSGSAP